MFVYLSLPQQNGCTMQATKETSNVAIATATATAIAIATAVWHRANSNGEKTVATCLRFSLFRHK